MDSSSSTSSTSSSIPPTPQMVVNERSDSSDDEDVTWNLEETLDDWYFNKMQSTIKFYKIRVADFRRWLKDNYNRDIDRRLKKKHLRLYFTHKAQTVSQMRATIVCIRSLCKQLKKRGITKEDVGEHFENGKQHPPKHSRNMSPENVQAFFAAAQRKRKPETLHILQLLAYAGIRRTALSRIQCTDIIESSHQKSGVTTKSYAVNVKKGKGNKSRTVQLRSDIGKALYAYSRSLGTAYLFPSKKNVGQPLNSHSIADRIKRIAKKIGQPTISMHAFRHFYASNSLHNGADLATVQQQLGHSSITTTSAYLHGNPKTNVSAMIDLSGDANEDITILHNFVPKPKKIRIRRKKKKSEKASKLQ
jgi:integrase/recombinase XerD